MIIERRFRRSTLTEDERRVLALAAEGYDDQAIARQLELTHMAVRKQLHSVYGKLSIRQSGINRRVAAVLWYLEED